MARWPWVGAASTSGNQPTGTAVRRAGGRARPCSTTGGSGRGGRRQVVFVSAPAGVGKTALIDVFVDRLRDGERVLVGRGQCVEQFGESEAYLPVLEALSGLCRGPDGQPRPRDAAFRRADVAAPASRSARTRGAGGAAASTVGASAERMLREMGDALESLTVEQPLVLLCEELHQCDRSTTELLTYLARRREPARLMLLGTYRSTEVVSRSHPLRDVVLDLRSQEECGFLRLELLGRPAVAAYLGARLAPGSTVGVARRRDPRAHRRQRPVHGDRSRLPRRPRSPRRGGRRDEQRRGARPSRDPRHRRSVHRTAARRARRPGSRAARGRRGSRRRVLGRRRPGRSHGGPAGAPGEGCHRPLLDAGVGHRVARSSESSPSGPTAP